MDRVQKPDNSKRKNIFLHEVINTPHIYNTDSSVIKDYLHEVDKMNE